jgi:protein SCO1/2
MGVFYWLVGDQFTDSSSKLAVINPEVASFNFIDQDGKAFTQNETDNKVYVTEYFFTTCEGICPKMNANMRRVFDKYKDNKDFLILSHTCQPEVDSIALLKDYERKMINGKLEKRNDGSYKVDDPTDSTAAINNSNWFFVTGDKAKLYEMARQSYLIDNGKPDTSQIKDQFIHTQFFALVDRNRRVRAIYDGLKENEIQKLMGDIDALLNEKVKAKRFMNGFSNNPG